MALERTAIMSDYVADMVDPQDVVPLVGDEEPVTADCGLFSGRTTVWNSLKTESAPCEA
jgi:hypothetical protein